MKCVDRTDAFIPKVLFTIIAEPAMFIRHQRPFISYDIIPNI